MRWWVTETPAGSLLVEARDAADARELTGLVRHPFELASDEEIERWEQEVEEPVSRDEWYALRAIVRRARREASRRYQRGMAKGSGSVTRVEEEKTRRLAMLAEKIDFQLDEEEVLS